MPLELVQGAPANIDRTVVVVVQSRNAQAKAEDGSEYLESYGALRGRDLQERVT
jgi:hypothetical protein